MKTHKQPITITSVRFEKGERSPYDVWVYCDFENGGTQGFGGFVLDKPLAKTYAQEICEVFGVKKFKNLKGLKGFALYSFGEWNDPIEGLEAPSGKRFTISGFRKRHFPDKFKSALEEEQESLRLDIQWATRRIAECNAKLKTLNDNYIDWETEP